MNDNIVKNSPIDKTDVFSQRNVTSSLSEVEQSKTETEHELETPINLHYTQGTSTQISETNHDHVWSTSFDDRMDSLAMSQRIHLPSSMDSPDVFAKAPTANNESKKNSSNDLPKLVPELSWRSVRVEGSQLPFSLSGESGLGLTQMFEESPTNSSMKRYVTIRESQELRQQMADAQAEDIDSFDSPRAKGRRKQQSKPDSKFAALRMPAHVVHHFENNHLNTVDADGPDVSQLQVPASIGKSMLSNPNIPLPFPETKVLEDPSDAQGSSSGQALDENLGSAEYSDAVQRTPLHDKSLKNGNGSLAAEVQTATLLQYSKKTQQRENATSGSLPINHNDRRSSSPMAALAVTTVPQRAASSSPPRNRKRRKIDRHQIIDDSQPTNLTHHVGEKVSSGYVPSEEVPLATNSTHVSNSEEAQSQKPVVNSHRVFAKFNKEFYPGTVLRPSVRDKHLVVKFEDDQECDIPEQRIFRLDIQPGDVLRGPVNDRNTNFTVNSLEVRDIASKSTCIRGYDTIKGHVKGSDDEVNLPVSSVYLNPGQLSRFSQRHYVYHSESTSEVPSPSIKGTEGENTPVKLISNIFSGALFSLSLGIANSNQRNKISRNIVAHGGTILDDGLHELFQFEVGEDGCIRGYSLHKKTETFTFACIIANSHSESVKYLQALALRLPCLATKFITDSIRAGCSIAWEPYMLAAGVSEWLGDNIKSMIVPPFVHKSLRVRWDTDSFDKPLRERRVIFISADKGKTVDDMHLYLLLFLGATITIADSESPAFALASSKKWDMVYCPNMEKRLPASSIPIKRRKWLIQSLILGRVIDINLKVD